MQALKEWAIVCKALKEGRQVILLRKGGILEYRQGFEVKHEQFLLFPTYEHQSKDYLQDDYADKLDEVLNDQPSENINKMDIFAQVVFVKETNDRNAINMLAKYHIWNENYVNMRMNYNPKKPMSIMFLRVFKLDAPISIHAKDEWMGCKSWIPVNVDTVNSSSGSSSPVIDDLQFDSIASEVKEVLSIAA
jgi:hypothetical protein